MLKIAVAGVGRMGSHHLAMYRRLIKDGADIKLIAICDPEESRLNGTSKHVFNMGTDAQLALDTVRKYLNIDELLAHETPDIVDVVCPTYLHCEVACKALKAGCNVLCEKPMALDESQCDLMISTAKSCGKKLMIAQCLRFWREYVYLKRLVNNGTYGAVKAAYFWRGGFADHINNPSWHDWIIDADKGGGGLFDQHIHDTDFIRLCFGEPNKVVTTAKKFFDKSRDDIVSTNYIYPDKVVNAIDDISYAAYPFSFGYRVNFDGATVEYTANKLTVYPMGGTPFEPNVTDCGTTEDAYYNEIVYFISCVKNGIDPVICTPEDAKATIALVKKEAASAAANR